MIFKMLKNRTTTAYHQFKITAPKKSFELLIRRFMAMGSTGVIEDLQSITVFFPLSVSPLLVMREIDIARSLLRKYLMKQPITVRQTTIPDSDWNESWKRSFKPITVGTHFSILPPWERVPKGRIPLVIDPGMAFGTGHHETTRSCLVLMEKHAAQVPLKRFLDLGTGTGLLAIAARRLGFTDVIGLDTDPLSIKAARRNRTLNKSTGIVLREGSIDAAKGVFGMIAANLIAGCLIELAQAIADRTAPAGIVIMSGILQGQDKEVVGASKKAGLAVRELLRDGKWVSLVLERSA